MKIKEISELTGKGETTIRRWITSAKMAEASAKMAKAKRTQTPAEFTLVETVEIIRAGGNETLANLLMENGVTGKMPTISEMSAYDTNTRLDRMESIIDKLLELQVLQASANLPQVKTNQIALPDCVKLPKQKRAELREIINRYADDRKCEYRDAWNQLYQQIYYQMDRNIGLCAKNRGMDKLDYIESEGIMDDVLYIARKLFEV